MEFIAVGAMEVRLIATLHKPCIEVAGHTVVTQGISTVGGDVDINHPIAFKMVIFSGWRAYDSIVGEYDDTTVAIAYADFVFSTNHAEGVDATQAAFLDDEFLVAIVKNATEVCYNHFLTSGHIGRAADDLLGLTFAKINSRYMEMVAIGVGLTGQHLSDIQSLEAAFDGLNLIQSINL